MPFIIKKCTQKLIWLKFKLQFFFNSKLNILRVSFATPMRRIKLISFFSWFNNNGTVRIIVWLCKCILFADCLSYNFMPGDLNVKPIRQLNCECELCSCFLNIYYRREGLRKPGVGGAKSVEQQKWTAREEDIELHSSY